MDQLITNGPRWLLLAALVYAPWAYGATRDWAIAGLDWLLGAAVVLWLLGCLLRQAWPSVPPALSVTAGALMAQAWFMALNAKNDYDTLASEFIPRTARIDWAPGSMHRELSLQSATHLSLMLAAILLTGDLARKVIWRKRLLWTMCATGVSVVLLGLTQKLTHATAVFWGPEHMGETFFATWRYHANAGAFMNLVWPLLAGGTALAFLRDEARWKKILPTAGLVICLVGLAVNTSRASGALALLLGGLWIGWMLREYFRGKFSVINPATAAVTGVILVALIVSVSALVGVDTTLKRWGQLDQQLTENNARLVAAKVCLEMIPEAGWWGFGPGTFQTTFPYFTQRVADQLGGRWVFAHQDYLQTLTEWGYLGSAGWAVLVLGAIGSSLLRARRYRDELSEAARVGHFGMLVALLGVLLHALVDFPLQIASIQLYVAVLLGLLWSGEHWLGGEERALRPRERRGHTPGRAVAQSF